MCEEIKQAIREGRTALGIEFGSTRIKAVLVDESHQPVAMGNHDWENRLEDGLWTYRLEDAWRGLQAAYQQLSQEVWEKYGEKLRTLGAVGVSAMMHGYLPFDRDGKALDRKSVV